MIGWLKKKIGSKWTRRTAWTPLLLSQRQLQRVLAKERMRADRDQSVFSLIILRVAEMRDVQRTSVKLARILHRRLRETDEKGHLNFGRIGVVLPSTEDPGAQLVLSDILRLANESGLHIEGETFVYPEEGRRGGKRSDDTVEVGLDEESAVGADAESMHVSRTAAMPISFCVPQYPTWKRALDIAGAGFGLLMAAPVILIACGIIRLTSRGPSFFAQERVGYLGRRFWIYKLRTMVINAEDLKGELMERNERDGPAFKMRNDPRITRFGYMLRSTGLDELPQLFNVLSGDMSLVGPRPLPVDEADQCQPWQKARMDTKPGLTCYWQLAKSRKMSFVEWMRLDMRYARACNLWLDTKLILSTFSAVILGKVGH